MHAHTILYLQAFITTAVQSLSAREPTLRTSQCWLAFLNAYKVKWQQQHAALAIIHPLANTPNPQSSPWLACLRAGPLVTLLRAPVGAEAEEEYGGARSEQQRQWQALRGVVGGGLGMVRDIVGQPCLDAFVELVASGEEG